jgi:endo-1,4-beta-D-glucanase Y
MTGNLRIELSLSSPEDADAALTISVGRFFKEYLSVLGIMSDTELRRETERSEDSSGRGYLTNVRYTAVFLEEKDEFIYNLKSNNIPVTELTNMYYIWRAMDEAAKLQAFVK